MKIEGSHRIAASRAVVWDMLMNPEVLGRSIPGCEKLEQNPDGTYRTEMKVGIAAVRGSYQGRIEILDPIPNELFRMKVDGQGSGGFLKAEGTLTLTGEESETLISYSGEAQVGGVIAGVGQRLMLAAAKQIINQFFKALSKQLSMPQPPAPAAPG